MIVIIDYGIGNLQSLKKAFDFLGVEPAITEDAEEIRRADAVVLPGVGAFASGMRGLKVRGLAETVREFAESGRPLLGICLGAQILLSKGLEFGEHDGLGMIPGRVVRFPEFPDNEKIPHVGWNSVRCPAGADWSSGIFRSFPEPFDAYFVHSYILQPERREHLLGVTTYGGMEFCSAVRSGNVYGTQFHPEKSGEAGLQIMKNFLDLVG